MNEPSSVTIRIPSFLSKAWANRGRAGRWLARQMVPNVGTLLLVGLLILTANVWARPLLNPGYVAGPSATTVNYQGRLADSGGTPLNGTYGMTIALWDAPTEGNLLFVENHAAVPVSNGLFSVGLGSQTSGGIPTSTWNGDRYLEIAVGGETLSPRELIRSVPIAGMALTVPDGAITQEKAPFAPVVWRHPHNGALESVAEPVIYSGWFNGGAAGHATYDLSSVFTQIDAVLVTRTRGGAGTDTQAIFMVTDAAGTDEPIPSEIQIWARDIDGNPKPWITAYVLVIGK